jgi:hypothetical protein
LHIFSVSRTGKIDARSQRRTGRIIERRAPSQVPRGAVDISDFDLPAAVAGEAVLPKCTRRAARRSSVRGIPGSAAVICRRTNPALVATGAARPGEAHLHATDRRVLHQPARLTPCQVFSMRCSARRRLDNPRRGCFGTRAETRTSGPAMIERPPCRSNVSHQRRHGASRPGPSINFPVRWALGCGTGLIHCRGQTGRRFAAEMRYCADSQGKTARAIGWRVVPILQGWLTRHVERVRCRNGGR